MVMICQYSATTKAIIGNADDVICATPVLNGLMNDNFKRIALCLGDYTCRSIIQNF